MKSGWTWTANNFDQAAQLLRSNVQEAVEETAYDIVEAAQERAPVDTGALRASIHPVFMSSSGYSAAVASARVLGKQKVTGKIVAPVAVQPQNAGEISAAADVAVSYAPFLEYGAMNVRANKWMPAQPFLTPALESCFAIFEKRMQKALGIKVARVVPVKSVVSEDDQRDAYYRKEYAAASRETNQWKAAQMDDMRARIDPAQFKRLAYGQNRTRTGKQYRESFGEMWERLRNDYEGKRNFD